MTTTQNLAESMSSFNNKKELRDAYLDTLSPQIRDIEEEIDSLQRIFHDVMKKNISSEGKIWNVIIQINGFNAIRIKTIGPRGGEKTIFFPYRRRDEGLRLYETFDPEDQLFRKL